MNILLSVFSLVAFLALSVALFIVNDQSVNYFVVHGVHSLELLHSSAILVGGIALIIILLYKRNI